MNPMLQNRPDVSQTPKGKLINTLSNISLVLNLVVGAIQLHWACLIVFIIAHTVLRMAYVKLEDEAMLTNQNPDEPAPPAQPQSIRYTATVITMLVMANILYWLGFGIRQGINTLMG